MQRLKALRYALVFLLPLQLLLAMQWGIRSGMPDLLAWWPLLFFFVFLPVIDFGIGRDTANVQPAQEREVSAEPVFKWLCLAVLPVQLATLYLSMQWFMAADLGPVGEIGWLLSQGIISGALAINTAHELIHKNDRLEQWAGALLLVTVGYHGFKIEHLRGHHVHVSTPEDPSSAPYGMTIWQFLPQALRRNSINAWALEADRLRKAGLAVISRHNEMLVMTLIWLALSLMVFTIADLKGLAFFWVQGLLAAATLEVINYVEHYGLERRKTDVGYERTTHLHSWNSSYTLSNAMLFNLQRHSDHHAYPKRRYGILRHFDESPQLPAGYPTMFLLALFPPLWRRVMDPRVEAHRAALAS